MEQQIILNEISTDRKPAFGSPCKGISFVNILAVAMVVKEFHILDMCIEERFIPPYWAPSLAHVHMENFHLIDLTLVGSRKNKVRT